VGYLRLRMKIEAAECDARAREDKIKAESLARESKLKSEAAEREATLKAEAELIQQNAQKFVQDTATRLQEQIFAQNARYDALQDKYTELITDHATLSASHTQMSGAFDEQKKAYKDLDAKHESVLTQVTTSTKELHKAQIQLKDAQIENLNLLKQIEFLNAQMAEQNERIRVIEETMSQEKIRRVAAEERATKAEKELQKLQEKQVQVEPMET